MISYIADLVQVGSDIAGKDWCGTIGGSGRKEIKVELKQRLGALRNDLLLQAGQL